MEPLATYDVEALAALVPLPAQDANKYSRGKLVLVAGSAEYPGAACLAAAAAARLGAGYVETFCAPQARCVLQGRQPSAVARSWEGFDAAAVNEAGRHHPLAVVAGPGTSGAAGRERELVLQVLRQVQAPVLVDGGALAVLATAAGRAVVRERAEAGWPLVATPHGGEAARLARGARVTGLEGAALAEVLADAYGCTVVLKGPRTFVAQQGSPVAVVWCGQPGMAEGARGDVRAVAAGTPALAKAGTGDVLAGAIGALLAQGLAPRDAAMLGASLHGMAGRVAAERLGVVSVMAEDVVEALPVALRELA